MMNYYPPTFSLSSIIRQFPEMGLVDTAEQQRLQDVEDRKKRGKGAPKKAKSKGPLFRFRFFSYLFLTFSSVLFFLQPTAGVLRGSGRERDKAFVLWHNRSFRAQIFELVEARRWGIVIIHGAQRSDGPPPFIRGIGSSKSRYRTCALYIVKYLLSNLEYVNSTKRRPTLPSINGWSQPHSHHLSLLLPLLSYIPPSSPQMPLVPSLSPATGNPTPDHFIHTTRGSFVDNHGRTLLLRGVNLSGSAKAPLNKPSYVLDEIGERGGESFVGRPLNLEDGSADVHLARLRGWGFNMIRYVVTWEALEHEGP